MGDKRTTNGSIKVNLSSQASLVGKAVRADNGVRDVYAFLGVPFAQPPTGERRFQPPRPLELWKGDRNAKEFGKFAIQDLSILDLLNKTSPIAGLFPANKESMSEDCLFLNVWTPNLTPRKKLPVMVFIHGGGFTGGMSNGYVGTPFCDRHEVVHISINYRVNAFGFITTGDDVLPGNLGLRDQIEALKWVQKYIENFGGDPDNVTIVGESAGAISVIMLMLIEQAKGLFHRAISQSGHPLLAIMSFDKDAVINSQRQCLKDMGCKSNDSKEIKEFLAKQDSQTILKGFLACNKTCPYVDGNIFKDSPNNLIRQGKVHPVDLMIGQNSHEGIMFKSAYEMLIPGMDGTLTRSKFREWVEMGLKSGLGHCESMSIIVNEVMAEYLSDLPSDKTEELELNKRLVDFMTESFMGGFNVVVDSVPNGMKTYAYYFNQRPSFSKYEPWIGADHANELFYMYFDSEKEPVNFNKDEMKLARTIRAYWARFATNGTPKSPSCPDWPCHTSSKPCYMELNTRPQVRQGYINDSRDQFWSRVLKNVM